MSNDTPTDDQLDEMVENDPDAQAIEAKWANYTRDSVEIPEPEEDKSTRSEVIDDKKVDKDQIDPVRAEEKKYTEEEQKAIEQGWKPEGVEGKPKKSAAEFLRDGELFDTIKALKKQNEELKESFKHVVTGFEKTKQQEIEKALQNYERQKIEAIAAADVDTVLAIDKSIDELKKDKVEMAKEAAPVEDLEVKRIANDFMDRNKDWFNDDSISNMNMKKIATERDLILEQKRPDLSFQERLHIVEREIREAYPDHPAFKNQNREAPPAVARDAEIHTKADTSNEWSKLSRHQKMVFQNYKNIDPTLTVSRYLKEMGE